MLSDMFWFIAIICGVMIPLLAGAFVVEVLAPHSRTWIRRVRGIEEGRRAMGKEVLR